MMILHRYITKTIMQACGAVILAVLSLSFFIGLLTELRDVGTGDYGFQQAVYHVLLKLPHDIYQFFPMLTMLGGVLGLGILSAHQELVVMRASGFSVQKIIRSVLMAAVVIVFIATLIGECVAPRAIYLADKHKESAENGGQAVATAAGVWVHEGNNFLRIEHVVGSHHLEGVQRYEFDPTHNLIAAYYAKTLDYQEGHWKLHDLEKTTFSNGQTLSEHFVTAYWDLTLSPGLLNVGMVQPEELSLPALFRYSSHLVENGLQATRFQYEFWKRIFQPFTTLVMVLLAVPFVFGAPRSVTMGWRILFAVVVGFVFYILNAFLGQISVVFQVSPLLAALFPTGLFGVAGYVLMVKQKG